MTSKSPSSTAVDAVIQGEVKLLLKAEGFRKTGRSFHRARGEFTQVVNIQASQWNSPDSASFTVNLNVVLPFLHEIWTGRPLPKNPASAAPICSQRIGMLLPDRKDTWWTVMPKSDPAEISDEVAQLIRIVGLPFLDQAANTQYLCEQLGADEYFSRCQMSKPLASLAYAILLCHLGSRDEAKIDIERTQSANRIAGFSETIAKISARLGFGDGD